MRGRVGKNDISTRPLAPCPPKEQLTGSYSYPNTSTGSKVRHEKPSLFPSSARRSLGCQNAELVDNYLPLFYIGDGTLYGGNFSGMEKNPKLKHLYSRDVSP